MTLEKSIYSLAVLLLLFASLSATEDDVSASEEEEGVSGERLPTRVRCYNGKRVGDRCVCKSTHVGTYCHRETHCTSFERNENGTCSSCDEHWIGDFCDVITCDKGDPNEDQTACICHKPHSGVFCETQNTNDVYLHYNSLMYSWGPIGVLTIIPLYIVLYGCRYMARKRQIKRVERALEEQRQDDVDSDIVDMLLHK